MALVLLEDLHNLLALDFHTRADQGLGYCSCFALDVPMILSSSSAGTCFGRRIGVWVAGTVQEAGSARYHTVTGRMMYAGLLADGSELVTLLEYSRTFSPSNRSVDSGLDLLDPLWMLPPSSTWRFLPAFYC